MCYFDRTEKPLEAVKRAIDKDGSFSPTDRKTFHVQPEKKANYYISQLLYGVYHNKPMSWVKNGRVNFNDRNSFNLTSANLSHTHADEPDNINRRIWCMGDYIFLHHKKSGSCFFCNYEEELFRLLCHHRIIWGYQKDLGRLQATVIRKKRKMKKFSFGLHTLIYAYYHYNARYNNFVGAIRRLQRDFAKDGYTIDHLDNNQANNTMWNLSPMLKCENSEKHNFMSRVRYPFFLFAVYTGESYRLLSGRVHETERGLIDPEFDAAFIKCATPKALVSYIKQFMDATWPDGLTPAKRLENAPNAPCLKNYFGDFYADGIRKLLHEKDEHEFYEYQ